MTGDSNSEQTGSPRRLDARSNVWLSNRLRSALRATTSAEKTDWARKISHDVAGVVRVDCNLHADDDDLYQAQLDLELYLSRQVLPNPSIDQNTVTLRAQKVVDELSRNMSVQADNPRACKMPVYKQSARAFSMKTDRLRQVFRLHLNYSLSGGAEKYYRSALVDFEKHCFNTASQSAFRDATEIFTEGFSEPDRRSSILEEINAIVSSQSFNDRSGTIVFQRNNEKISLMPTGPSNPVALSFYRELRRSAENIWTKGFYKRFLNVDTEIHDLFLCFYDTLKEVASNPISAYSLWSLGNELNTRLVDAKHRVPEALDRNATISFETMLTANQAYLGNYEWLVEAIQRFKEEGEHPLTVSAESSPAAVIGRMSQSTAFDAGAQRFLRDVSQKEVQSNVNKTRAIQELGAVTVGTLRGSLTGAAEVAIQTLNDALETITDDDFRAKDVRQAYRNDQVASAVRAMLFREEKSLQQLAQVSPGFFEFAVALISTMRNSEQD